MPSLSAYNNHLSSWLLPSNRSLACLLQYSARKMPVVVVVVVVVLGVANVNVDADATFV